MEELREGDGYLAHYGTKRHSGRYPWGSGDDPYQHNESFLQSVHDMKKAGYSEKQVAEMLGFKSTGDLRARISAVTNENRKIDIQTAQSLKAEGYSNSEIARQMGRNESSIRGLLDEQRVERVKVHDQTIDILKEALNEHKYVDVGEGTEYMLNISNDRLEKSLRALEEEGYSVCNISIEQMGTGKFTTTRVLAPPGVDRSEISKNRTEIGTVIGRYENENGEFIRIKPPVSIDKSRVAIKYGDEGPEGETGSDRDGVIFLRKGVQDISLGKSQYAQVRIVVDGDKYLKGMAMYSDDLPDGVDILFNTNKPKGTPFEKVLKSCGDDASMNKLMAQIARQRYYEDADGNQQQSAINIVREQGEWDTWSKSLASQMLSKQPISLVRQQLKLSYDEKYEEFNEIASLTNPEIKKKLLISFADACDAGAVDLKAAALPRQAAKVILPIASLKDNEIYAPTFKDGESVVAIRYPHGGRFEIPDLVVNNKNAEGKSLIFNAPDAVGINSKVAAKLSGADFDGDTVLIIPNNNKAIKTAKSLEGLKDFDPKKSYPAVPGMKVLKESAKGNEMGKISNLITDMTIKGATAKELERAVRHSMVVIDAAKHKLNYKQSEIDNDIASLKQKYQYNPETGKSGGASTLISRAKSKQIVPERDYNRESIDINTGERIYKETGRYYDKYSTNKKTGEVTSKKVLATQDSTKMREAKDARTLISVAGSQVEQYYANYANGLKALANAARKESLSVGKTVQNPEAKKTYAKEVARLNSALNLAKANAPYERQAQILAKSKVDARVSANPDISKEEKKKLKGQMLVLAREQLGSKKPTIDISDSEWKAIESGALSSTKIMDIFNHADEKQIRKYATPRTDNSKVSAAKLNIAKSMNSSGYSLSEIADRLGVSTSTVSSMLNGQRG